jgi:hypothetical protein
VTGANRFCYCSSVVLLEGGARKKNETIVFSFLFYFPYIIIFDLFLFLLLVLRILIKKQEYRSIKVGVCTRIENLQIMNLSLFSSL